MSRGTSSGLVWLIESDRPTPATTGYATKYPHMIEGRIIDCGIDRGHFCWFASDDMLTDPAYVRQVTP